MNFDQYRAEMAAAHKTFQDGLVEMMNGYSRVQTVFTHTMQAVEGGFAELKESNEELRRLILEQGQQIRELRDRLNGH